MEFRFDRPEHDRPFWEKGLSFPLSAAMLANDVAEKAAKRVLGGRSELVARTYPSGIREVFLRDSEGARLGALWIYPEGPEAAKMHNFRTANANTPGRVKAAAGSGTLLLLGALDIFLRSPETLLEWKENPAATGFYAKFFEKFGACLDGLGMDVAHDADSGRRSVSKRR